MEIASLRAELRLAIGKISDLARLNKDLDAIASCVTLTHELSGFGKMALALEKAEKRIKYFETYYEAKSGRSAAAQQWEKSNTTEAESLAAVRDRSVNSCCYSNTIFCGNYRHARGYLATPQCFDCFRLTQSVPRTIPIGQQSNRECVSGIATCGNFRWQHGLHYSLPLCLNCLKKSYGFLHVGTIVARKAGTKCINAEAEHCSYRPLWLFGLPYYHHIDPCNSCMSEQHDE